jgi:hypothetical protein
MPQVIVHFSANSPGHEPLLLEFQGKFEMEATEDGMENTVNSTVNGSHAGKRVGRLVYEKQVPSREKQDPFQTIPPSRSVLGLGIDAVLLRREPEAHWTDG